MTAARRCRLAGDDQGEEAKIEGIRRWRLSVVREQAVGVIRAMMEETEYEVRLCVEYPVEFPLKIGRRGGSLKIV